MFITNKANPGWQNINSIFGYDSYNRLKSHVQYYPDNASKTMNYTYDKDGNILTYQKLSSNGTDLTFFTMTYNPTSGRLQNLKKGTTNYSYSFDVNGNIINDYHRQLEISKYNSLNLIKEMRKDNGDGDIIKYDYDESGNRIAKYYQSTKEYYLRDHLGKELAVYDLGHPIKASKFFNLYGANGLAGRIETNYTSEQIYSRGGWITQWLRDDERFYYIKDHLGSIRITVDQNNEITNGQDYLPLGSIFREYNIASTNEKYDFTEKERDTETGLNYFGARYYDSDLGRWTSVDPLADKYPGLSPYNYIANNPLRYYDPDGRGIKEFFQGIAKAISFDVTVGFQVGLSGNVYGRNIGGNINIISTSILSGDLSSSPELNNGELSKGVSFGVGIAGISNEVTSATETSETRNGIYTIITETNTNTNTSSTTLGPISAGTTKTTTTTKNVLTGQTNKVVTKTGSVGASKNVKIKGAAGIGVEVKINTSEAWNAVKALFDDNKEDK
jgi:RHS repeat-associated protein